MRVSHHFGRAMWAASSTSTLRARRAVEAEHVAPRDRVRPLSVGSPIQLDRHGHPPSRCSLPKAFSTPLEVAPKRRASSRSMVSPRRASKANPSGGGRRVAISSGPAGSGMLIHVICGPDPGVAGHVSCKPETRRPLVAPTSACQHEHRARSVGTHALHPPRHVPTRSLPIPSPPAPRRPQLDGRPRRDDTQWAQALHRDRGRPRLARPGALPRLADLPGTPQRAEGGWGVLLPPRFDLGLGMGATLMRIHRGVWCELPLSACLCFLPG